MDPNLQTLVGYIKSHRAHGTPDSVIWAELRDTGWPDEYISQAMYVVDANGSFEAAPQPQMPQLRPLAISQPEPQPVQSYAGQSVPQRQPSMQQLPQALGPELPAIASQSLPNLGTLPLDPRQKYTLRAGIADAFRGLGVNWVGCLLMLIIVLAAGFGILFALSFAAPALLTHISSGSIGFMIGLYLFVSVMIAVLNSMVLSAVTLSVRDGLDGKHSKVGANLRYSLSRLPRVILTTWLVSLIAAGPIIVGSIIFIGVIFASMFNGSGGSSGALTIGGVVFVLASLAWLIIAYLRFSLAPYVALLEPGTGFMHALKRSKQLVVKGGQWFIVKGVLLILLLLIILAVATGSSLQELSDNPSWPVVVADMLVTVIVYGVLYALYRNRVAVKG